MTSSEAVGEQVEGRRYEVKTFVGFTGAHTNYLLCSECGSMVGNDRQPQHDEFHNNIEKIAALMVRLAGAIDTTTQQLEAYTTQWQANYQREE